MSRAEGSSSPGLSTEADMVLDALTVDVVQGVLSLVAGLPDDHVEAAIVEIQEVVSR